MRNVGVAAIALGVVVCAVASNPALSQLRDGEVSAARATAPLGADRLPTKPTSFAILEDYDVGDSLNEVARDFGLARELGIHTWRGSISWLEVEPTSGRFEFAWLERFAELAADSGIVLRPYIAYTPAWVARPGRDSITWHDPPRDLVQWRSFVDTLARVLARHPNVRSLEIYNEENTRQWWDGSAGAYDSVLATAAASVRAFAPRLGVLAGGTVWPDADWTAHVCRAARVDAVSFHAYPETWTPDSVTIENYLSTFGYDRFVTVERATCAGAPVWINETGFATVPGKTERDQALWWARAIATFLAEPEVQHIGIYRIKDLRETAPAIGGEPNYHLGLTYANRRKKLAFHTVKLLAGLLASDSLTITDRLLRVDGDTGREGVYIHGFRRRDGTQILLAWTRSGARDLVVTLPYPVHSVTRYSIDGNGRVEGARENRVRLHLAPGEVEILELR